MLPATLENRKARHCAAWLPQRGAINIDEAEQRGCELGRIASTFSPQPPPHTQQTPDKTSLKEEKHSLQSQVAQAILAIGVRGMRHGCFKTS